MLLKPHILAYARCLAGKVCGLVRSTWGTSPGEDKPGARDEILNTKVACRANIPPLSACVFEHVFLRLPAHQLTQSRVVPLAPFAAFLSAAAWPRCVIDRTLQGIVSVSESRSERGAGCASCSAPPPLAIPYPPPPIPPTTVTWPKKHRKHKATKAPKQIFLYVTLGPGGGGAA